MILLADEVEFRPRRLMALEAIEPQEVVNFLRSVADNFRAVLVGVEGEELPIVRRRAESLLLLDHSLVGDQLQHGSFGILALSRLGDIDGARQIAGEIVYKEVLYRGQLGDAFELEASTLYFGSPACTLPAHSKSAAKHETLLVSAKIFVRLCFIRFPPCLA